MADVSDVTMWLAVLAIATVLQTCLLLVVAVVSWRAGRQLRDAIDRVEREQVVPLVARMNDAVDDWRDVASRARALDDGVRGTVAGAAGRARDAADVVMQRAWPAYAIGRAAYAVVSSLFTGRAARPARHS